MASRSRAVGHGKSSSHKYVRTHQNLKKRKPDPDQVVTHLVTNYQPPRDEELPGSGEFYCRVCSRHFLNAEVLATHERAKPHKRALKRAEEDLANPYTSEHAVLYGQ